MFKKISINSLVQSCNHDNGKQLQVTQYECVCVCLWYIGRTNYQISYARLKMHHLQTLAISRNGSVGFESSDYTSIGPGVPREFLLLGISQCIHFASPNSEASRCSWLQLDPFLVGIGNAILELIQASVLIANRD